MNAKNFWKMMLSFGLLISLILPTAGLANAKLNASPLRSRLAADKRDELVKYGQLAAKYVSDCEGLTDQARPSGERLKRCLTIAKELRDKFTEFNATLDTIIRNIKNGNKWTKELDEQFDKEATGRGIDAETINKVKQSSGVRAFLQENITVLKASKGDLDNEVKELEAKIQKNASTQNEIFQTVSYKPAAEYSLGRGITVGKIIKTVAIVLATVCNVVSGGTVCK